MRYNHTAARRMMVMRRDFSRRGRVGIVIVFVMAFGGAAFGADMPKAGSFKFDFCFVGQGETLTVDKHFTVMHYTANTSLRTEPAGGPFDRQSGRCWGTLGSVAGKSQEFGYCEVVDQDKDRWYLEYHGNAEGTGGTYTAVHGTGKYAGMTLNGEYSYKLWPTTSPNTIQGCNPNKGTYKLAQ